MNMLLEEEIMELRVTPELLASESVDRTLIEHENIINEHTPMLSGIMSTASTETMLICGSFAAIMKKKLWKDTGKYRNFEDYCLKRWGKESRTVRYKIEAYTMLIDLASRNIDATFRGERGLRLLAKLDKHKQAWIIRKAQKICGDKPITEAVIAELIPKCPGAKPADQRPEAVESVESESTELVAQAQESAESEVFGGVASFAGPPENYMDVAEVSDSIESTELDELLSEVTEDDVSEFDRDSGKRTVLVVPDFAEAVDSFCRAFEKIRERVHEQIRDGVVDESLYRMGLGRAAVKYADRPAATSAEELAEQIREVVLAAESDVRVPGFLSYLQSRGLKLG